MRIVPVLIQTYDSKLNFKKTTEKKQSYEVNKTVNFPLREYNNYFYPVSFGAKKQYSQNELDFLKFKRAFFRKVHAVLREYKEAYWNFETDASNENAEKYAEKNEAVDKIFADKKILALLKGFKRKGIKDPALKVHLDSLIAQFELNVGFVNDLAELNRLELEIQSTINNYLGTVEGKKFSVAELDFLRDTERDGSKRKIIYQEQVGLGDLIADKMVKLVKKRNKFARKLGYPNYFEYMLNVDETELFDFINKIERKTRAPYNEIIAKENEALAKVYGISPGKLRAHHYYLQLSDDPFSKGSKYIKSKDELMNLSVSMFSKMGWDLSQLPIYFDIDTREGKNHHAYCFSIDGAKDIRILANVENNFKGLEDINHEMGHALYCVGISEHLPYLEKNVASEAINEAIAMLFEKLQYREKAFLKAEIGLSESMSKKLEQKLKGEQIKDLRRSLFFIDFERKMYENPNQDLGKLWYNLRHKYLKLNRPERPNNYWATIPQYLTDAAYLQNYLRAEVIAAQIYEAATEELGPLTQNPQTADFFKKRLFRLGSTKSETEAIEYLTGKHLSTDSFFKQIM